jgi:GNAT superfamily N-acetyltransferase
MLVTTRRATHPDADAIAGLYLRARQAAAQAGTIPAPVHGNDDVRHWIADLVLPRLECWIACISRIPVGMLVLDRDWIEQLYVEPELTGGGIGSELLAVAKRQRPGGLRLWTFVSNTGAQRFYARHGFHEVDRTDGRGNEEQCPDIQYCWTREPDRDRPSPGRVPNRP